MVILNQGYKGRVIDVYNKKNIYDKNTLYYELITSNPKEIKLITINEGGNIKIKRSDEKKYNKILELLKNTEQTLVKKFIYINYFVGSKKHNFNNELDGYKNLIKIFKDKISVHTTIKEGFKFNGKKIYGMIFNDDYYIFLEKCYQNLEDVKFTSALLNKCSKEIMETLDILNKHDYIHNDLKPNNMILCKDRFKIIDWESSNYVKNQSKSFVNTKNGNMVFNHPLKFYNLGIPYFMYEYIYDIDMVNYKFLTNMKEPIKIKELIEDSFNKVIEKHELIKNKRGSKKSKSKSKSSTIDDIEENKHYFLKLYDYWAFALSIIYLAEVNKTHYNKSIIHPILKKFLIKVK